jgi:hypothetical protein
MTTTCLIAHVGHTHREHEHITWWKPDSRGYTICIEKAGAYAEDEAQRICRLDFRLVAVPKHVAEHVCVSTPYYRRSNGTLAKLYDGPSHRPVPNTADAWKHLIEGRMSWCAKPDKPTPIGAKKSRAIYIDAALLSENHEEPNDRPPLFL